MGLAGVTLVTRLRLVQEAVVNPDVVPQVLESLDAPWLGESTPSDAPSLRSFLCDLKLHAGGSDLALFRKAAVVSLGGPRRDRGRWVVPIEWRAASMTAMFPVFAGQLRIEPDQIELDGRYAPPAGGLGYLLDVAQLRAAARQTG